MAVIIEERLKKFFEGTQGMGLGTRDNNLTPAFTRGFGVVVIGKSTIKVFISKQNTDQTIKNLEDNKMVALVQANPLNFESYQLKGTYIHCYDASKEDEELVDNYLNRFNEVIVSWGLNEGIFFNLISHPLLVIEFEVEQVFEQTPKIGTGKEIKQ